MLKKRLGRVRFSTELIKPKSYKSINSDGQYFIILEQEREQDDDENDIKEKDGPRGSSNVIEQAIDDNDAKSVVSSQHNANMIHLENQPHEPCMCMA